MQQRKWSLEEKQFMVDNYTTTPVVEIAVLLNRTPSSVQNYASTNGLKKDPGRPRLDIRTPTGTEIVNRNGYILVKGEGCNVWRLKHRLVWEQYNGPIPPKHFVTFKDGNRSNCDITNLNLLSGKEMLSKGSVHNMPDDIRRLYNSLGVLNKMIRKRKNA